MRNFKILISSIIVCMLYSCEKKIIVKDELLEKSKNKSIDSLVFIKDTTIFSSSSEGEKLLLFRNKITNDSILKSSIYGEMGKTDVVFIFNKKLLNANRLTTNYEEPIYVNSKPKISNQVKENLKSSVSVKNELTSIFMEDVKFFRTQKIPDEFNKNNFNLNKWEGIYYVSPYDIESEKIGNYYLEIFKNHSSFGFSGDNDFLFDVVFVEKENRLYVFDKSRSHNNSLQDAIAVLTKINGENFIKSKLIKMVRHDVKESLNGFPFKWKKTVEEVSDTPE